MNKYEQEFNALGHSILKQWMERDRLVLKYSWAIPNDAAISRIAKDRVIEMGAGTGYWASLIAKAGGDIICFDEEKREEEYHEVLLGGVEKVREHTDRALLLCWPPYADTFAHECLREYGGDKLFYIGEEFTGCCGDDGFFEELSINWEVVEEIEIPQWIGINDKFWVYKKRIRMPDGTDGMICIKCGKYYPYVKANNGEDYICYEDTER